MKKTFFAVMIFALLCGTAMPGYALSNTQSDAIQGLLEDACEISGVPGMSVSIVSDQEVFTFHAGYANREQALPANENTLFELASVSKAFTGAGLLLLEEQGFVSMTDPIQTYLPWLTFQYQGEPIAMESVTLGHFLHHTSGLTNSRHIQNIPQGTSRDMLQKTVEQLVDAELAFLPGTAYEYGTVNYDVIGLVIEAVSGQSYEEFMHQQVLQPLGLHNTYVDQEAAQSTGQLAQGYRSSFFMTMPYHAPAYRGNKPAGYLISSAKDMARWMGIQMGLVEDIPPQFQSVIENSHQGDFSVPAVNEMYYAVGWAVNADQTIVEHAGQNPNFSTQVAMLPEENTAICLLTNGSNTNISLVSKIKSILNGDLAQSYDISSLQLSDILMSSATILFSLLAILLFFMGLHRMKTKARQPITKGSIRLPLGLFCATIVLSIVFSLLPLLVGYDWPTLLVWQTYSFPGVLISIIVSLISLTWFLFARQFTREVPKNPPPSLT